MKKSFRNKWIKRIGAYALDYALISLIVTGIAGLFILLPFSFSLFNTSQTLREQYSLIDAYHSIYNSIDNSNPSVKLSNDIVIIDIKDIYDRTELADILAAIHAAHPKAIGLDVTFYEKKDSAADAVISRVAAQENVITPCALLYETGTDTREFENMKTSFYVDSLPDDRIGFVNIDLAGSTMTCRYFIPEMSYRNERIPNFAVAVAETASPQMYDALEERGNDREYINFDRTAFLSIDAAAVAENMDLLTDKIVLVGDKGDLADQYVTPMDSRQPGVEIHAHAIDTIIHGKFIDIMPEAGAWFLAFCITFLLLPLMDMLHRNEWTAIFIPLVQTVLIFIAVFIGYQIFVSQHYYIKIIYTILAIGFMDVGTGLYRKTKSSILKKKNHEVR